MNKENTKKLLNDFPKLYKQYYWPKEETCMCWGFDIKDGWFDLIYNLSADVVEEEPSCEFTQVKQKFGLLRVYAHTKSKQVKELIRIAEIKSSNICEICGEPGKMDTQGWFQVLCPVHTKSDLKQMLKYRGRL